MIKLKLTIYALCFALLFTACASTTSDTGSIPSGSALFGESSRAHSSATSSLSALSIDEQNEYDHRYQNSAAIPLFEGREEELGLDSFTQRPETAFTQEYVKKKGIAYNQQIEGLRFSPNGRDFAYYLFTCAVDEETGKPYFWNWYYTDDFPSIISLQLIVCIDGEEKELYKKENVTSDYFKEGIDWLNEQYLIEDDYLIFDTASGERLPLKLPEEYFKDIDRSEDEILMWAAVSRFERRGDWVPFVAEGNRAIYLCMYSLTARDIKKVEIIPIHVIKRFNGCAIGWKDDHTLYISYIESEKNNPDYSIRVLQEYELTKEAVSEYYRSEPYAGKALEVEYVNAQWAVYGDRDYVFYFNMETLQWSYKIPGEFEYCLEGETDQFYLFDTSRTKGEWVIDRYVYDLKNNIKYGLMFEKTNAVYDNDYIMQLNP